MKRDFYWRITALIFSVIVFTSCSQSDNGGSNNPAAQSANTKQAFVVQCTNDCAKAATAIEQLGGSVDKRYSSVNALAISLPAAKIGALANVAEINKVFKDKTVQLPQPRHKLTTGRGNFQSRGLPSSTVNPNNYSFNNLMTGAAELHANGITGAGVIVAVIDSGVANNPEVEVLFGKVIGGEDFVGGVDEPSATSALNDDHGTMVGSMIAAEGGLIVDNDSEFALSVLAHSPESIFPLPDSDTESAIPMLGSAPNASLYALKVFGANEDGSPSSRIIAAMDRALTLKRNFDSGMPSTPVSGDGTEDNPFVYDSLNIQVVNMSLGGPTLFAGHELEDLIVREMLAQGIVVVVSAGNEGAAAMTGASPGTSVASVTVGAMNSVPHERILRDLQYGLGTGELFRPNNILQTAYFSSRGPTADGRAGVSVMANGFGAFVQGADGFINFVSGTSFSSPTVAGAVALLREAFPNSSAAAIRDALIRSADDDLIQNESDSEIDRGEGFIDLVKASRNLQRGKADDDIPELPRTGRRTANVERNIRELDLKPVRFRNGEYRKQVELNPGQTEHFFIRSELNTDQIQVSLSEIEPELPIEAQNAFFADGVAITVVDAPTSYNDVLIDDLVYEDSNFTIDKPQSGLLRIAVMGDWTNAGKIKATLNLAQSERKLSTPFARGEIADDELDVYDITVDENTTALNLELSWRGDWGTYPTHDLDLLIFDPNGEFYFDGATLDSPERVQFDLPATGTWQVLVTGYMLHGLDDRYTLRVTDQDGRSLAQRNRSN